MKTKEYNHSVDQYSDAVYRYVLKHTRNEALAADIVQEAFEVLWLNRKKVDPGKVRSYLFSVAHNSIIDVLRRQQKQKDWEEIREDGFYYTQEYKGVMEFMDHALEQLPEIQKSVLLLRDYEGYTYKEIGNITGLNESQVKVYIHRARKFLKAYIVKIENIL